MSRALALLVIGLVFGGGIGFVIAAANGVTLDGHDHTTDHGQTDVHAGHTMSEGGGDHDHSELVDAEGPVPTVTLHVTKDPVAGWNLHAMTTNFTFAPNSAGMAHVNGEGHGHVYANGAKIARLYSNWMHIDQLPKGEVTLQVTLNSNDHRTLALNGQVLEATVVVTNTP